LRSGLNRRAMPQLFQPTKVVTKEIVTKDGECHIHITLDLNININAAGGVGVDASVGKKEKNDDEEVQWVVPQFTSGQKVKFGKKE